MLSMIPESDRIRSYLHNTPLAHEENKSCGAMHKVCRQVSIESPGRFISDCVLNLEVPVPNVPPLGARIQVVYAGACYRMRNRSSSTSSISSTQSTEECVYSPSHHGYRDTALFPGYEVAGVIDAFGDDVVNSEFKIGQRVVIYPYDGIPHGYAEYIIVPDLSHLVAVPDDLALSVASMLPTGAVLAKNAVITAHSHVVALLKNRPPNYKCKILIVGTGGVALWAIRIAEHHFNTPEFRDRVKIVVASLRDEGFKLASELLQVNLVQWNEHLYEKQIIERTKDACDGSVDIVIDLGTTFRSLRSSLECLSEGGVVLVSEEVAERLLPKVSPLIVEKDKKIEAVAKGSIELLKQLVDLVASGDVIPTPHSVFDAEEAPTVIQKLCNSEIAGRAILRFHNIQ